MYTLWSSPQVICKYFDLDKLIYMILFASHFILPNSNKKNNHDNSNGIKIKIEFN